MTDIYLAVIAVAVAVIAATQVALAIVAVRAAIRAREVARRLEDEIGAVLAQVRSLSADAARSAALVASQVERVDQFASRVTLRIEEFTASPLRQVLALVRAIIETVVGDRPGSERPARSPRGEPVEPGGDSPD